MSEVEDLDTQLSLNWRRADSVLNGDALEADIKAQIAACDAITLNDDGSSDISRNRRVYVRRAALDLLYLASNSHIDVSEYTGMLGRGETVPDRPQFIAGFNRPNDRPVVIKSYGRDNEVEVKALAVFGRVFPTSLTLINSGFTRGTWFVMPRIEGASLTDLFAPRPGQSRTHVDGDGRPTAVRRYDQPVNPFDALAPTRQVAQFLAQLHTMDKATTGESFPDVTQYWEIWLSKAEEDLNRTAYGQLAADGMPDFARQTAARFAERVFSHGDPFPPNVMVELPSLQKFLIDPNPIFAMRSFDASRWLSRVGNPNDMTPLLRSWVAGEPGLDPVELASCLAIDTWRFAADLETIKIEGGKSPSDPADDLNTIALIETSNALRHAVEQDHIRSFEDLYALLDDASIHLQASHANRGVANAGVALLPGESVLTLGLTPTTLT